VFDNVTGEQCHSSGADEEATHSSQRWVTQLVSSSRQSCNNCKKCTEQPVIDNFTHYSFLCDSPMSCSLHFIICSNCNCNFLEISIVHGDNNSRASNNNWRTLFHVFQTNTFAIFTQHLCRYIVGNEIKWSLVEYWSTAFLFCV
jgi:hypothetical protein